MRSAGLEGMETVLQEQRQVARERHDNGLFSLAQNRQVRLCWPVFRIPTEVRLLNSVTVFGLIPISGFDSESTQACHSNQWG